jgi:hypothetical protein
MTSHCLAFTAIFLFLLPTVLACLPKDSEELAKANQTDIAQLIAKNVAFKQCCQASPLIPDQLLDHCNYRWLLDEFFWDGTRTYDAGFDLFNGSFESPEFKQQFFHCFSQGRDVSDCCTKHQDEIQS